MSCNLLLSFVLVFSVSTLWKTEVAGLCITPCERPEFCNDGDMTAIPGVCDTYYMCEFNQWRVQDCPPETVFNISNPGQPGEACQCVLVADDNTCPYRCPTDEPTMLPPGPCDNVPDPCENGTKYADQSNCTFYHLCVEDALELRQCGIGPEHGYCNMTGLPCAFDINLGQCVIPNRDFDCETRCTARVQEPQKEPEEDELIMKELLQDTSVAPGLVCLSRDQVCNRPDYCSQGQRIPEGTGCTQYFECVYGYWALYTCAPGSEFDIGACECVIDGEADCEYNCETTTRAPPQIPGPCDSAPTPCLIEQRRVADHVNCEDFHVCVDGAWQRRNCIGGTSDDCDQVGYACAYDVSTQRCIHPDSSFSCDPRCPTNRHSQDHKSYKHPKDVRTYMENKVDNVKVEPYEHKQHSHVKSGPLVVNEVNKDSAQKDSVTEGNQMAATTESLCLGLDRVCERPQYCSDGNTIGDPTNCTIYHSCAHNRWTALPCGAGTEFDAVTCACVNVGAGGTCANTVACPTPDPDVTVPILDCNSTEYGTCDGKMVGDACDNREEMFADMMCAEYYYKCFSGTFKLMRHWCSAIGDGCEGHGCVFDIYTEMCRKGDVDFDPYYRCLTTTLPTTTVPTTVDTGQTTGGSTGGGGGSNTSTTTTTVGPTITTTDPSPGLEPYAIVGIVIVSASGLFLLVILVLILVKKTSKTSPDPDDLYNPDALDNEDTSDDDDDV